MVAKINRGASLYGAIAYNQQKVGDSLARIISGNRMIADITESPDCLMQRTLWAFESYLLANRNTEKPILHISLNPSPEDRLTDAQFADLAKEYMEKMGYGDQPYIVYLHEDIGRRHIHIVSTCVNERGEKIDDAYEWKRSMQACRELEQKFGLKQHTDKKNEQPDIWLKKADYTQGDLKRQVANILKSVFTAYRFQTFGEYSALLSCFNIEAKQVKGEHEDVPYTGIVYAVTDDSGKAVGAPIKSSLIDKRFGYQGLEKRLHYNAGEFKAGKWQPKIRGEIARAMQGCMGNRKTFIRLLQERGIDAVFRINEEGRIYGTTFVDHNNKEVYNGSRLGKEFSANVFEKLFTSANETLAQAPLFDSNMQSLHRGDMESSIEQAFGMLSFDAEGPDPQEEALARRLQRQKKKRRSRGLS